LYELGWPDPEDGGTTFLSLFPGRYGAHVLCELTTVILIITIMDITILTA
jgi:hypothetical protein